MAVAVDNLVARALGIIDDEKYTSVDVIALMNSAYSLISGEVLLKDLETVATINTSTGVNHITLPTDYQRNLSNWAYSPSAGRRLKVYDSVSELFMAFNVHDAAGPVVGIARGKLEIYYQPIPALAEAIRIVYHAYPATMTTGTDVPAGIPEHLMDPLLVHYACWRVYEQIEDGVEEEKTETAYHAGLYEKALADLKVFLEPPSDKPDGVKR